MLALVYGCILALSSSDGGLGVGLQYELVVVEVDNLNIFCDNISAKKQAVIEAPVL